MMMMKTRAIELETGGTTARAASIGARIARGRPQGGARTDVAVADVRLLEPAVQLELLVVRALRDRLDLLRGLVELLLAHHGYVAFGRASACVCV
jgi:hypothetical protein